ncbi:MAG: HEPN domain-containing protein [archaeon]
MKDFEFFIGKGDVKHQHPNMPLSRATFKESEDRLVLAKSLLATSKPKYVLENAYEAMREAADALLYKEGYKSYSHEASIIYLKKKEFNDNELREFDRFRKIRNSIKYYGKDCDITDARSALELAEKIISNIQKLLKE